jgi:Leucine-rich repeat (LRR) protein
MYKKFITPLFLIILVSSSSVFAVESSDSLALVDLYDSTDGNNWNNNENWKSGPVSTWFGVTVDNNRVTELDLGYNNLAGTIPSSIGDLDSLTSLFLNNNQLTGSIPSEIGNLTKLTYLSLSYNQLTDSIPPGIWGLTNLELLILSVNQLSGSIPSDIGNLTNLEFLHLYDNQFTDTIPSEIYELTNLTNLILSDNQFTGEIPADIGDLTNLTNLGLANNQLTGSIPSEIGNLTGLMYLHLSENQLTGSIPPEIGNLTSITELDLSLNQFTDSIPSEIGNLTNLENLYLNSNQFTGSIPPEIGNLTSLTILNLNNNYLEDLPDLSGLSSLEMLGIRYNKFTFEDIEPNIDVASTLFLYSPQDSVGETQDTTIDEGSSPIISVSVGGEHNQHQWKKDGTIITDATNSIYTISSASSGDAGSYICEITNTVATELTLYSRPITISIASSVPEGNLPKKYSMNVKKGIVPDNQLEVQYALPGKDNVKFSIYDIRGAKVKELSEENPAGFYSVKIDMSGSPAGAYFLKMEAKEGHFTATKKVVLVK